MEMVSPTNIHKGECAARIGAVRQVQPCALRPTLYAACSPADQPILRSGLDSGLALLDRKPAGDPHSGEPILDP